MSTTQQMKVAKTLKKLNDDPGSIMMTNKAARMTLTALAATGRLKSRYTKGYGGGVGAAIRQIKRAHKVTEMQENKSASADVARKEPTWKEKVEEMKEERSHERRMDARAKSEREEVGRKELTQGEAPGVPAHVSIHERIQAQGNKTSPTQDDEPPRLMDMDIG